MSVQAVIRPSALPLPQNKAGNSDRKCMVPVLDRNRRAGSTPTRTSQTLIRTASVRNSKTSSEKNLAISSQASQAKRPKTESNKENNKAKKVLHNNNNNITRTKDFVKNNAAAVSRKNSNVGATANSARKSSSAGASKVKKGDSNYLRTSHHQPDLVKVSSPKLSELARLESVLDEKNRENDQLRTRLRHNAKGFEALAITVNHFGKELEDWNKLDLSKKLNDLNTQVQSKEAEIEELRRQLSSRQQNEANHQISVEDLADQNAIIEHLENRLKLSEDENEAFIDKLKNDHKSELDLLKDSHKIELKALEQEQENYLKDHELRHKDILHEVEEKWKQKLALQLEEKGEEMSKISGDFERQSEKWSEVKRNLEDQLHSVQTELRNQEMAVSAKQKGDLLIKSTQNKLSKVMAEVDSLKAVLEMKNEEIHALRLDVAKLEDKLEDFDRMKTVHGKVSAQMEDLKAQLNEKQALERKLSEENRQLYTNMEREMNAKRRLTMEKEELEWKMRSFNECGPMSMSMMEGYSGSPFDSFVSSSPMSLGQSKGSLTASYTEHCPQSLPPFTGRSRKSRPVSAPPGKFDMASLAKSLKDNSGPDSPRLSEVVEKTESLSWKIEYQENSDTESSPLLKRKNSSPMMSRSLERPKSRSQESPTRSLSRSNSTRKKIIPSFEPLSESTESDSLEEQLQSQIEKRPQIVKIDDLDDDIGDISSSSEIEIDEPLGEVTTPQIEALMFPTPSASSSSEANMSSPDADLTIRAELCKQNLTSSMPNYDLNQLFSGVQDSGGEGMMAFTPTDDLVMMSSVDSKSTSEMADSTVSMTSWSTEDFSAASSS